MFKKDYTFGIKKEIELLPIIKKAFNDDTITQLDRLNVFDYKGDNKYIKLNSFIFKFKGVSYKNNFRVRWSLSPNVNVNIS